MAAEQAVLEDTVAARGAGSVPRGGDTTAGGG